MIENDVRDARIYRNSAAPGQRDNGVGLGV